jgi:hypothetical protein
MKAKKTRSTIRRKNMIRVVTGTALILMVPLVAMQFTDEVRWDLRDFIVIGGLLISTGLLYELITSKFDSKYYGIIAIVLAAALVLTWMELAVGIFGTPFAGS